MARPTKQGIDYFPLDCQFDDKTEMYIIEQGVTGFGVLVSLWQMIYSGEGYYILDSDDLHLLIKRRIDVGVNEVSECIKSCLRRNIFDEKLHQKFGIITSKAVQDRYFLASKKKKNVSVVVNYIINGVSDGDNWVKVCGNATKEKEKEEADGIDSAVNEKEEVKKDQRKKKPSSSTDDDLFDSFWSNYPKKVDKIQTRKSFNRLTTDKKHLAISDASLRYANTEKQFIPSPRKYVLGEKWDDERQAESQAQKDQRYEDAYHAAVVKGIETPTREEFFNKNKIIEGECHVVG